MATALNTEEEEAPVKLTKKDFESSQEVRWCPGCGDYSILANVQKFLPTQDIPIENHVFVSGIGCASRFPYYMNTYGFHTIHGRAPAFATGVKSTNTDLSVWVITGDGDSLSIGGNHLIHILRRNVDLNILLFNNRIYGLTKGQYSPTSELGKVTKSTPYGSADHPVNPLALALGAQATFVARTLDIDAKHMAETLRQASEHRGTSFIEIYQNCNIFNDGAFTYLSERSARADAQVLLKDGDLLIFGKKRDRGIALDGLNGKVVEFEAGNETAAEEAGVIRYDSSSKELAKLISELEFPNFPVPMGLLYKCERPSFNALLEEQVELAKLKKPLSGSVDEDLRGLYGSGDTWEVR